MIKDLTLAWYLSVALTALLYLAALSLIFPMIKAKRRLQERLAEYGAAKSNRFKKHSKKIDDKRLKSLQVESKLKTLLTHPYPYFQMIKFLFYRSNVFANIKGHIAVQVIGCVISTDILFLTYGLPLSTSFLLGILLSLTIHYIFLSAKESSWRKAFTNVFPLSLDIINRGLKSGMTLGRGIAMVSEEVEDPVGSEFNYIASQLQIGITPQDALTEAAGRIGVDEFRFFSLALNIQREMGGSLADILGKLAEVIRERDRFRRKVWTLSSEGRATAMIVGSLPLILAIMVELISPGYIRFFFTDPKGKIMLWICGVLSITGAIVITRMMKVED
jgi:tight adherence protein B